MDYPANETPSFLELFDKLARAFVPSKYSTTGAPFRLWADENIQERRENEVCKKLKFAAFDSLLDLKQKRDSRRPRRDGIEKPNEFEEKSLEQLVFESVFTCPIREERKLFLEMLSDLVKQVEAKAGSNRTVLWLHFLASLQNSAGSVRDSNNLTPSQVSQTLLRDRVSKTSTLKRFFEVDDVPDCSQNKMFESVNKRSFTQFFAPPTNNTSIGPAAGCSASGLSYMNDVNGNRSYQFGRMLPEWQSSATSGSVVEVDEGFSEESLPDDQISANSAAGHLVVYDSDSLSALKTKSANVWDTLRAQMRQPCWNELVRPRRSWDHFGRLFPDGGGSYPQHRFATDHVNRSPSGPMNVSGLSVVSANTSRDDARSCVDMIRMNAEPESVFVDEQLVISHCLSVIIGVSSSTFLFQISDSNFVVQSNLRIANLSPQSLRCLLEDFADAGTCFERLSTFSENVRGLFVGQLALEVNRYLKTVHALVVKIYESVFSPEDCKDSQNSGTRSIKLKNSGDDSLEKSEKMGGKMSLLKLHLMTKQMRDVLIFLLEFVAGAPRGHALLSYIYRKALDHVGTPWYDAVLRILASCSQPYISLIEDWIYHGNLNEEFYSTSCEEFVINTEPEFLKWRSRKFWTKGFSLNVNEDRSNVPLFLRDHVEEMFSCGKTILLLKLCQPQHYLVSNFLRAPSLKMTFDWQEVQEIEDQCTRYTKQLEKLIQAEKDAAEEKENEEERRKMEMVAQVRRAATMEFTELAKRVAIENENTRVKRAAELLELKQEMEKDLQRRRDQTAEEKRRDREQVELGSARDAAELERIKAYEEQARQELIAYYEELGAEAMLKEQRALWRIRRHQLDEKRFNLFRKPVEETFAETNFNLEAITTLDEDANEEQIEDANGVRVVSQHSDQKESDSIEERTLDERSGLVVEAANSVPKTVEDPEEQRIFHANDTDNSDGMELEILQNGSQEDANKCTALDTFIVENKTDENQAIDSQLKIDDDEGNCEILNQKDPNVSQDPSSTGILANGSEVPQLEERSETTATSSKRNGSKEVSTRPMIRVGISMNKDTEGILTWTEDSAKRSNRTDTKIAVLAEENDGDDSYFSREFLYEEDSKSTPYIKSYPELFAYPSGDLCTKIYSVDEYYSSNDVTLPLLSTTSSAEIVPDNDVTPSLSVMSSNNNRSNHVTISSVTSSPVKLETKKEIVNKKDGSSMKSLPLEVLMKRLIVQPLQKQSDLANKCARDLFLVDHQLWLHFEALRRTLLLADPEFAHGFCTSAFSIFDPASDVFSSRFHGLSMSPESPKSPAGLSGKDGKDSRALSIAFFNRALNFAVERSRWKEKDVLFERLLVKLRIRPGTEDFMDLYDADCFSCIALLYRVGWPLNVIVSDSCVEKYLKLFHLLLALRRLSFVLNRLFFHLKNTERLFDTTSSPQFAKVQFGRHVMQHHNNVLSDYLHEQLLSLSWNEFQQAMAKAQSVDDMHYAHANYLNSMICRALLNDKASKVLKLIKSMMTQSVLFERQVSLGSWAVSASTGHLEHSNFSVLMQSVKSFHNHSKFLNKIVTKLSNAGYQPHLQNFLLKMDFNSYFSK